MHGRKSDTIAGVPRGQDRPETYVQSVQEQVMRGNSTEEEISVADRLIDLLVGHEGTGVALSFPGGQRLSYADLARQVNDTGRVLRAIGVGPGDRVATILPNGPTMASAFLGVAGVI